MVEQQQQQQQDNNPLFDSLDRLFELGLLRHLLLETLQTTIFMSRVMTRNNIIKTNLLFAQWKHNLECRMDPWTSSPPCFWTRGPGTSATLFNLLQDESHNNHHQVLIPRYLSVSWGQPLSTRVLLPGTESQRLHLLDKDLPLREALCGRVKIRRYPFLRLPSTQDGIPHLSGDNG